MDSKEFFQTFVEFCIKNGTIGERNNNGADSYYCPSCYSSKSIEGYCNFASSIDEVNHTENCDFAKMYLFAITQLEE